jgi:hypothetical protein
VATRAWPSTKNQEQDLGQELVAHAAIEGLADAVLHRLARRDEMPGAPDPEI